MAVSDPCPDVPTPTGTLQGIALFSWSGSAWTPSGVPAPSVATPTGVLRGCAGFSWDGSQWQPAGRAQPSVPTPNGTLDGVALYNWNGSSWQPASGKPSVPTPSGTLEGVAVFNFDGTSWQPTGQAAPEVPTPYGTLKGVAAFSWSGTAWAAFPQPSLDLQFTSMSVLDPRVTFTRASIATYFDATGTLQTAASGVARFDYDPVAHTPRGLLIEETRANVAFPSIPDGTNWAATNAVVTTAQTTSPDGNNAGTLIVDNVTSGAHQLQINATFAFVLNSYYVFSVFAKAGTAHGLQIFLASGAFGSAWANFDVTPGAGAAGTLGGTGVSSVIQNVGGGWYRCIMAAQCTTAATAAVMVVGLTNNTNNAGRAPTYAGTGTGLYLWGAQAEAGTFSTSFIPTVGAAVTRAADNPTLSLPGTWYTTGNGSLACEFSYPYGAAINQFHWQFQDVGTGQNQLAIYQNGGAPQAAILNSTGGTTRWNINLGNVSPGAIGKEAVAWNATTVLAQEGASANSNANPAAPAAYNTLTLGRQTSGNVLNGYVRRIRYWPQALTAAQLAQVCT